MLLAQEGAFAAKGFDAVDGTNEIKTVWGRVQPSIGVCAVKSGCNVGLDLEGSSAVNKACGSANGSVRV